MFDVYKKLLHYVPRERYLAYLALFLSALSSFFTVGGYFYLNRFLERLILQKDGSGAGRAALLIAGMLALASLIYVSAVLISHVLGFRLETNLRKRGIDGLTDASFRFFDLTPSGKTRKIIDDNAAQTHMIVAHLIPDNTGALITPLLLLFLAYLISPRLGITLTLVFLLSLLLLYLMMGNKNFMEIYQNSLEKLSAETVEYVRGIQVIKIFGADLDSFKSLSRAIQDYARYAYEYSKSCKKPYVLFQLIFFGLVLFLIPPISLFIAPFSDAGKLASELIMLFFLGGTLFNSIMKIMYVSQHAFEGKYAVNRLEELYASMQKDKISFGREESFPHCDIDFEEVDFSYLEGRPVLEKLSFHLPEKKIYALLGDSGSGKSTIVKLISGFYKINGGCIRIGGRPIESYSERALSENISFVFQDARLFKMSIYDNVSLARRDAKREEVLEALHLAGCDSILDKFRERENTLIGSKGVYLSGGEKQRISIARAILKKSRIVILDEASAAVDPENEHELQLAFSHLMKGRTVIMIAHRLSSIRNVDEILVLEKGRIIERGSDRVLMAKDSRYRRLQELYGRANEWRVEG